jgi:hypothetical protein
MPMRLGPCALGTSMCTAGQVQRVARLKAVDGHAKQVRQAGPPRGELDGRAVPRQLQCVIGQHHGKTCAQTRIGISMCWRQQLPESVGLFNPLCK